MAVDYSGFLVQPATFPGVDNLSASMERSNERQFELEYRMSKDMEAEDWRKLNLIQELTDLSKHQTGSDVANAIGNRKMGEVYQKYTAAAKTMSPAELQSRIQKEMGGIVQGMEATKGELELADEQLKLLKQKYPSLDVARMGSDYRQEILSRRIENNTDFANPLKVQQSSFDVTNPEFLSRYVTGNKNLSTALINPQGVETMKVFKGSPRAYTEYTAKLPFWKKESFDRNKLSDGFISGKDEPKLEIKASPIPGFKSADGQPLMAMDEDVYKRFSEDETMNLELTAAARQKYKGYDDFNPEEKNLAKRNVLYDKVKEYDQSDYYPSKINEPPRTYNRTNINVQSKDAVNVNDVYSVIDKYVTEKASSIWGKSGEKYLDVTELPLDAQSLIVSMIPGIEKYTEKGELPQSQIKLKKEKDGSIGVYGAINDTFLGKLPKVGTNLKAQPDVKAKRKVIGAGEPAQPQQPIRTPKDIQKTRMQKKDPLGLGL